MTALHSELHVLSCQAELVEALSKEAIVILSEAVVILSEAEGNVILSGAEGNVILSGAEGPSS